MIRVRKSDARGRARLAWLDSRHTFSFGDYHDPEHMGFGPLRVLNEDRVVGGGGFADHSHRDMEIISYVVSGGLEHRDSIGNGSVIRPGDVQVMRAGTGITHSEYNESKTEPVHFLQIWIVPESRGLAPAYQQKQFPPAGRRGKPRLVVSRDGRDGSLGIARDASLYAVLLEDGESFAYEAAPGRALWLQVVRGRLDVSGVALSSGDGAAVTGEPRLEVRAGDESELLFFDLEGETPR